MFSKLVSYSLYLLPIGYTWIFSSSYANAETNNSIFIPNKNEQLTPPVKVVQNRFFVKAGRPEVSIFMGKVLNESYSDTFSLGLRAGGFYNEWIGAEYSFTNYNTKDSADLKALRNFKYCADQSCSKLNYVEPDFSTLSNSHSITLMFAPIYGKINFMDLAILYSDINLNAGVASLTTSKRSNFAFTYALGQRFYYGKNYSIKLEATGFAFNETRMIGQEEQMSFKNAWTVNVGFSYLVFWGGEI